MAIRTGQYVCLLLSASLYVLLNRFNVDTGSFLGPEAGHVFHCCRSALFSIRKQHIFTGSTTVKNHMEANMLIVWTPSS